MNLKISLNLLLFFVLFSRTTSQVDEGRPVEPGELNFLVLIRVTRRSPSGETFSSLSAGSIINSKWILTCKHTFESMGEYAPHKVEVLAGTKKSFEARKDEGQLKTIIVNDNVIRHRQSDAALIYLGENSLRITDRAQPAALIRPRQKLPVGTTCTTSGWGLFRGGHPENAMKGEVRIFKCPKHSSKKDPATGLCYEKTGAQQMSAQGDSGGPITCEVGGEKEVVVGIVHGSCSQNQMRCSAAAVRRIHEWVQQHTKADGERDDKSTQSQILGVFAAIGAVAFYYSR